MGKHSKETRKQLEDIDRRSREKLAQGAARLELQFETQRRLDKAGVRLAEVGCDLMRLSSGLRKAARGGVPPEPPVGREAAWASLLARVRPDLPAAAEPYLETGFEAGWEARKLAEFSAAADTEPSPASGTPPPSGLAERVARLRARAEACPPGEGTDCALAAIDALAGLVGGGS